MYVCICIYTHPGGTSNKESACQCRKLKRLRFDPWVGKIPWRRAWQPIPTFLPGVYPWTEEPGVLQSVTSPRVGHDRRWDACVHTHTPIQLMLSLFLHLLMDPEAASVSWLLYRVPP